MGTRLRVQRPRTVCAAASACLAQPHGGRVVLVPAQVGWRGRLRLLTVAGAPVSGAVVRVIDGRGSSTVRTNTAGIASVHVYSGRDRVVRFVFAGSSSQLGSASSVRVENRPVATLRLVRGFGGPGTIELAGVATRANGSRASLPIRVQRIVKGRWVTVAVTRTSRRGWWNATTARLHPGAWRLRTIISGTPSEPVTIRLR